MDKIIGVLGGGQLGRMLTEAANRLNIKIITLDAESSPAKQINAHNDHVNGSFKDAGAIRQLARKCDVLTTEIEHIDTHALEHLSKGSETIEERGRMDSPQLNIQPHWRTIRVIQDKYKQKEHLHGFGIATANSMPLDRSATSAQVEVVAAKLGYPLMLKSRTEAYDGRGNFPIKSADDVQDALDALGSQSLYAEKWADFTAELAVMVVKVKDEATHQDWQNTTMAYPVVETVHEDSICKLAYAPARNIPEAVVQRAKVLARQAVAAFWGRGVFGVEMFLLDDGELLVNEIAPRPHNSGHYTMEACPLSQYDAHIRAILELPIPVEGTEMTTPDTNAIMLNILGGIQSDTHLLAVEKALAVPGARVHMYGKGDARPGRKMGHVTLVASTMSRAEQSIQPLIQLVDQIRMARKHPRDTSKPARIDQQVRSQAVSAQAKAPHNRPVVAITMGSDSDRFVLKPGVEFLKQLDIPFCVTITSAHRTPERMVEFAKGAVSRGIKVIIAAAGGAAHLPGMIAALTPLPVIGVPVKCSVLDGQDSLLSMVQMPRGCPVATVAINNSDNAAQLAVRILGMADVSIQQRLEEFLATQTKTVLQKAEKMENVGFDAYKWEE